jgi:predicted dehydrogenase
MTPIYGWVVGHGHMGSRHLKKLGQFTNVNAEAYDPPKGLVPKRSNPDFVIVATPANSHRTVAESFLKLGIPVLIEKPIATNMEDARILAGYPNCFVAHIERFNPTWKAMKVTSPRFIQAERIGPFTNRSTDIGVALDLMIHDIDLCLSLDKGAILDVRAISMGVHTNQDLINARIETENCVFQLTASRISQKSQRHFRVFSESSYWSADMQKKSLKIASWAEGVPQEKEIQAPPQDALEEQLKTFVAHVRGEDVFPTSGVHGFEALDLALQISEACR